MQAQKTRFSGFLIFICYNLKKVVQKQGNKNRLLLSSLLFIVVAMILIFLFISFDIFSFIYADSDFENPIPITESYADCYVCQYQDYPECDSLSKESCGRVILIGRIGECQWKDNKCQSRFKIDCKNWLDQPRIGLKKSSVLDTLVENTIGPGIQCDQVHYKQFGHGITCQNAGEAVRGCFSCLPSSINVRTESCSTFNDPRKVISEAEQIQKKLKDNQLVVWTAHQAVSSEFCTSLKTVRITHDKIEVNYGSCDNLGYEGLTYNDCWPEGKYETAICTDRSKGNVTKMCCPTAIWDPTVKSGSVYSWQDIDSVSQFCPGFKAHLKGTCGGKAVVERSDDGRSVVTHYAEAYDQINVCLSKTEKWCDDNSGSFVKGKESEYPVGDIIEYWEVTIPWTCYKKIYSGWGIR